MTSVEDLEIERGQTSWVRLTAAQSVYALRGQWRSRTSFIFTFAMPLVWLVAIGIIAGDQTIDAASGLTVMQFAIPTAVAMGTFFATFPSVAVAVSDAREKGVLKRITGTPLPGSAYIVGQISAASVMAFASLLMVVGVGILVYGVRLVPEKTAALAVTVILGILAFTAMGLAVAAIARTVALAEGIAVGGAVALSFISGVYIVGALPAWLQAVASVFPLKHYAELLRDQFDPYASGNGWHLTPLLVVAAWGVASVVVAAVLFRWQPRDRGRGAPGRREVSPTVDAQSLFSAPVGVSRRPARTTMVARQFVFEMLGVLRRPVELLFTVAIPVALFLILVVIQEGAEPVNGVAILTFTAASMVTWGAGVALFMNLAEGVARARERGQIKRMRGTPLPPAGYLLAKGATLLLVSLGTMVVVLGTGIAVFGLQLSTRGFALGVLVVLVGGISLGACGLLLASLVHNAKAVGAVGLVILFLLSFVSDVFLAGGPQWMSLVGAVFPIKHLQNALASVWSDASAAVPWADVAVLAAWGVGAGVAAVVSLRRQTQD